MENERNERGINFSCVVIKQLSSGLGALLTERHPNGAIYTHIIEDETENTRLVNIAKELGCPVETLDL